MKPTEHVPQGFSQSAGVPTQSLQRRHHKRTLSPALLRWTGLALLIMPPLALFNGLPAEFAWLMAAGGLLTGALCAFVAPAHRRKAQLPLRLPENEDRIDPGDPAPGGRPRKARGNVYMGRCRETKEQIWLSQDDLLRHMLAFGATGSGKTAALIGIATNLLCSGGGLIYSDAKGETKLYYQIHGLARRLGRDDDLMIMNYQTSSSQNNPREKRSNSLNLFFGRTADQLSQIFLSLMPGGGGNDPNAVFGAKAENLMSAILVPLVWLRDHANWTISLKMLSELMTWHGAAGLACLQIVPESRLQSLREFLESQPGMQAAFRENGQPPRIRPTVWVDAMEKASAEVMETRRFAEGGRKLCEASGWAPSEHTLQQFGYAGMYHTRALHSLSETYGDIYNAVYGEIKLEDIIAQRRILVVVLPAMEKSPTELQQLGKLLLSAIRGAVALGLGQSAEGSRAEAIDRSPTRSESIAQIIVDECAFQMAPGFATVTAQARSLSVSVIFAGQDHAGIKKASAEEADQIVANTVTKVFMRLAEIEHTAKLAVELGGKIRVPMVAGGEAKGSGVSPGQQTNYAEVQRVDTKDLQAQIEGQAHIIYGERLIRADMFYPGDLTSDHMRIGRFVSIPSQADMRAALAVH